MFYLTIVNVFSYKVQGLPKLFKENLMWGSIISRSKSRNKQEVYLPLSLNSLILCNILQILTFISASFKNLTCDLYNSSSKYFFSLPTSHYSSNLTRGFVTIIDLIWSAWGTWGCFLVSETGLVIARPKIKFPLVGSSRLTMLRPKDWVNALGKTFLSLSSPISKKSPTINKLSISSCGTGFVTLVNVEYSVNLEPI